MGRSLRFKGCLLSPWPSYNLGLRLHGSLWSTVSALGIVQRRYFFSISNIFPTEESYTGTLLLRRSKNEKMLFLATTHFLQYFVLDASISPGHNWAILRRGNIIQFAPSRGKSMRNNQIQIIYQSWLAQLQNMCITDIGRRDFEMSYFYWLM